MPPWHARQLLPNTSARGGRNWYESHVAFSTDFVKYAKAAPIVRIDKLPVALRHVVSSEIKADVLS